MRTSGLPSGHFAQFLSHISDGVRHRFPLNFFQSLVQSVPNLVAASPVSLYQSSLPQFRDQIHVHIWGAGCYESCEESTGAPFWCVALFQQENGFHGKSSLVPVALLRSAVLDNLISRMTALPILSKSLQHNLSSESTKLTSRKRNEIMRRRVFLMEWFESLVYTKSAVKTTVFQKTEGTTHLLSL